MRKGGYGRIVNLASGAPLKGVPLFLHYISSKGAVIAMTRGLARELGKDGITVNSLAPGFTLSENVAKDPVHVQQGERTRLTRAIQRDETPDDLVGTVSFLPRQRRRRLHDRPDARGRRRLRHGLASQGLSALAMAC
jgi:NAD(P)-dependent dehydrogenase (short-subunit alcohol dehydrogenase family)